MNLTLRYHSVANCLLPASEEKNLEEVASAIMIECDTTSESSDEAETNGDEITDQDRKFMKLAQDVAKKSDDEETKVFLKRHVLHRGKLVTFDL